MKFINRHKEMKTLEKEYLNEDSFVVIHGRRRTGKTTLIKEFIKDKEYFYFFADKQNENIQIERFKNQLAMHYEDDFLKDITLNTWDSIFDYLIGKVGEKKLVLVIDEFQYLCMVNKEFSSIFQRIYDEKIKESNIMLILCGSLINVMDSEVLVHGSPLYERRTAQIKLTSIKFEYYNEFFEDKSKQELIEFYSVTGGIPKYIREFQGQDDIKENIVHKVFNSDNSLYSEPKFLLQEEISDLSRYFSILQAVSNGDTKMSVISSRLGLGPSSLTPYISKLIELDILERKVPATEDPNKSKKALYCIKDNYLAFWFNFVYPYQSYLEIDNTDIPIKNLEEKFDLWVSKAYKRLCLESLLQEEKITFPLVRMGRWWDKNIEIDIVGLGENEIIFGSCEWSTKHVGINVLMDLKVKADKVSWQNDKREEYYILFSKSGFSQDLIELAKSDNKIILSDF